MDEGCIVTVAKNMIQKFVFFLTVLKKVDMMFVLR